MNITKRPIRNLSAMALAPLLLMSTCGGGGPTGSIRSTQAERVTSEAGQTITTPSRVRTSGVAVGRYVRVYTDGQSPRYRLCLGSDTSAAGCR